MKVRTLKDCIDYDKRSRKVTRVSVEGLQWRTKTGVVIWAAGEGTSTEKMKIKTVEKNRKDRPAAGFQI